MTLRTVLLTVHILMAAGWIGADFVVHALTPRMEREPRDAVIAWTRMQAWLHERYYATVVVVLLGSGVWLVIDGDWSWSSGFIWVGIVAIVGGATLGGGGMGTFSKRRLAALEAGDDAAAESARRSMVPLSLVLTALPIITVLAMVDKWKVG
ncbi:MAG: hypothetical protein M3Z03_08205 [Actinomycetota bacterium]|nr:hypothetical protein [Actinomycetota bacterium]